MSKVAFELRADHKDFSGGTVSLPEGETFDVAEALGSGGKVILDPDAKPLPKRKGAAADDPAQYDDDELKRAQRDSRLVEALDHYPALKRASVNPVDGGSAPTSKQED